MFSPFVGKIRGAERIRNVVIKTIGQPGRWWNAQQGREDFDFPGTWHILDYLPDQPDIVHCHNLHGGYFDLRALPWLSQQFPVVLTLHDAWLLSGHCAHSLGCEKWKTGCGECPNLDVYPAIRRDATNYNWQRKRNIYAKSHLYITTPNHWLMDKAKQSILAPAIIDARVIPNGVDLEIFHPENKHKARKTLGLPLDAEILLFVGSTAKHGHWKDYSMIESAVEQLAKSLNNHRVILICFSKEQKKEYVGQAEIWFFNYQDNPKKMAFFYQSADVYLQAAKAETFPNVIVDALACGTPVIATAVGGIPEQVKDGVTGALIPPGDVEMMAERTMWLLGNEELRLWMSHQAAEDVRQRFDLNGQVDDSLDWYKEILEDWVRQQQRRRN